MRNRRVPAFLLIVLLASWARADDDVARLVAATRDADRGVRYAAVQALGKAGAGVEALVAALDDPEWCVRQAAGHALARVGAPAIPALAEVARRGKPDARVEAVEALRRIGPQTRALWRAALDDEDPRVVFEALAAFRFHEGLDPEAAKKIEALCENENDDLRVLACFAILGVKEMSAEERARRIVWALRVGSKYKWAADWADALRAARTEAPPAAFAVEDLASDNPHHRRNALRAARRERTRLREHAGEVAKLLAAADPDVVRDAAVALDLIGGDPRPALAAARDWAALRYCRPLEGDALTAALDGPAGDGAAELRDWAVTMGRAGAAAPALRELVAHPDEEVRAAAGWALGRAGHPCATALGDRSAAVRAIAARFVDDADRLRAVAAGSALEPALLAIRRLGALGLPDAVRPYLRSPDELRRIAAIGVGEAIEPSPDDPRDVRIAIAMRYAIPAQLDDPDWRVQLECIRTHGRQRRAPEKLVRFLAHRNLALSAAAEQALRAMGEQAAKPVAELLDPGNEAVWHYAPRLFEAWGDAGAGAVSALVPVLGHANPTAREVAARCLGAIGPRASGANAALVHALSNRRLPVVAHAALALGRIGLSDELRAALASDRARVRAYAAFAMGWALGAARGIDQVAYEPRMPVLDAGEPDPGISRDRIARLDKLPRPHASRIALRGMWSSDPAIANPSAAFLEHDQLSPRECERTIELALAEGFRRGHPFDFERFRSTLGCNELPACLEFVVYTHDSEPARGSLMGDLHRAPRSTNIPAICWFERNEDALATWEFENLHQPFWKTRDYRAELTRWLTGRETTVWAMIRELGYVGHHAGWWLEDEAIEPRDERLLLDVVSAPGVEDGERVAVLRALARGRDPESEPYLLRSASASYAIGSMARAALARRGDPIALVRLVRAAHSEWDQLALLLEVDPRTGGAVLRERLGDALLACDFAETLDIARRSASKELGTEWTFEPFLGLESSIVPALLDRDALAAIALQVPGCRTRRLAKALIRRMAEEPPDEVDFDVAGYLDAAEPAAYRSLLRTWARSTAAADRARALEPLVRIGDRADASFIVSEIVSGRFRESVEEWSDLAPWISDAFAAWRRRQLEEPGPNDLLELLGLQCGFDLTGGEWGDADTERLCRAAREGRGPAEARRFLAERIDVAWSHDDARRREGWAWMPAELQRRYTARVWGDSDGMLARLARWNVGDARAQYWSAMRAGRYRWVVYPNWDDGFVLGDDLLCLPHWRAELESNCCKVSGILEGTFEDIMGRTNAGLYSCEDQLFGETPSDRVLDWFELMGGDLRWSPLARRYLPSPEQSETAR